MFSELLNSHVQLCSLKFALYKKVERNVNGWCRYSVVVYHNVYMQTLITKQCIHIYRKKCVNNKRKTYIF